MESIMSNLKECYLCHKKYDLHKHHIFYGRANRKLSEKHGCWVWLCAYHHNASDKGVHFDKSFDNKLKMQCQEQFEKDHTREEFRGIFGRSYL